MIQDTLIDVYQQFLLQTTLKNNFQVYIQLCYFSLRHIWNHSNNKSFAHSLLFPSGCFFCYRFFVFLFLSSHHTAVLHVSELERNWYWDVLRMHCSYQGSGFPSNSNHMKIDIISSSVPISCLQLWKRQSVGSISDFLIVNLTFWSRYGDDSVFVKERVNFS